MNIPATEPIVEQPVTPVPEINIPATEPIVEQPVTPVPEMNIPTTEPIVEQPESMIKETEVYNSITSNPEISSLSEQNLSSSPATDIFNQELLNNKAKEPDVQELPSINQNELFETATEPIITTDYNYQYDPVMPKNKNKVSKVDFREIINLIRSCSEQIEKSGYKIEVEEYDLTNLYQVVFKVEK